MAFNNEMYGNYDAAYRYYIELLDSCASNSAIAQNFLIKYLVNLYFNCYDTGREDKFDEFRAQYLNRLTNNYEAYAEAFWFLLPTFKGNCSDIRYVNARYSFNLHGDAEPAIRFIDKYGAYLLQNDSDGFAATWLKLSKADMYMFGEDYIEAQSYLNQAVQIANGNKKTDKKLKYTLNCFQEILYAYQGDYKQAIKMAFDNLKIINSDGEKQYSDYSEICSHLQVYYEKMKDYKNAVKFGKEAKDNLPYYKKRYYDPRNYGSNFSGPTSNWFTYHWPNVNISLANCYYHLGENKLAKDYIVEALEFFLKSIGTQYSNFAYVKLKNLDGWVNSLSVLAPLYAYRLKDNDIQQMAYDGALLYKQLSLHAENLLRKTVYETQDNNLLAKYRESQLTKAKLDKATPQQVDSLANRIQQLGSEILVDIKKYGNYASGLAISWQQVKNVLNQNEIAIEFISCEEEDGEILYMADILCPEEPTPHTIYLCRESELEQSKQKYADLYNLIWQPIEKYLQNKERIFFSSSNILHQIGIEYAICPTRQKPLSECYQVYRLSSTRELIAMKHKSNQINEAVLFGGIQYSVDESSIKPVDTTNESHNFRDILCIFRSIVPHSRRQKSPTYFGA